MPTLEQVNNFIKNHAYPILIVSVIIYFGFVLVNANNKHAADLAALADKVNVFSTNGTPAAKTDPVIVHIAGENTTTETIKYLPKEVDPVTGEKPKEGLRLSTAPGKVFARINGKLVEIPAETDNSGQVIDGMYVLNLSTKSELTLTTPTETTWHIGRGSKGYGGLITKPVGNLGLDVGYINGGFYGGVAGKF